MHACQFPNRNNILDDGREEHEREYHHYYRNTNKSDKKTQCILLLYLLRTKLTILMRVNEKTTRVQNINEIENGTKKKRGKKLERRTHRINFNLNLLLLGPRTARRQCMYNFFCSVHPLVSIFGVQFTIGYKLTSRNEQSSIFPLFGFPFFIHPEMKWNSGKNQHFYFHRKAPFVLLRSSGGLFLFLLPSEFSFNL